VRLVESAVVAQQPRELGADRTPSPLRGKCVSSAPAERIELTGPPAEVYHQHASASTPEHELRAEPSRATAHDHRVAWASATPGTLKLARHDLGLREPCWRGVSKSPLVLRRLGKAAPAVLSTLS
jgi:hypothetical protein